MYEFVRGCIPKLGGFVFAQASERSSLILRSGRNSSRRSPQRRSRRLSKDFEALPEMTEGWIRIAMIQLMVRRLAAKDMTFPDRL